MLHFAVKVVTFCVNVTFCGVTEGLTAKLSNLSSLSWKQSSHFLKIHFCKVLRIYVLVMLSSPQCVCSSHFDLPVHWIARRIFHVELQWKCFNSTSHQQLTFWEGWLTNATHQYIFIGKRFRNVKNTVLTLSLLRVINVKILLQLHKKYDITQYGELDFS